MSFKLEDVKGLGKKAENLKDAGIDSVEKLANAEVEDLLKIKGIGKASAEKFINGAKELISTESDEAKDKLKEEPTIEEEKKIEEILKKLEEKKKSLEGKKVENGDFVLVKLTGKTQRGTIFRVSSEEDAKTAGIYDEQKAKQGYYTPEFVIVGKPGFLNEGLTEFLQNMNYFDKKSVRVPPSKAFGKRDPQKIERIGIAKFRKLNEGKNPELGQEFIKKGTGQRGVVTNILQGRVIIDYNHPLAGQSIDYNIEVIDKIEKFEDKIEYFIVSKGIPQENVKEFKINYNKGDKSLEIIIPKMFLFQNLTYIKFGLALDLQSHIGDEIDDVKFIEIYEKMPIPTSPTESISQKVEEFNKEQEEKTENKKKKE
ncbi:MAG: helix-hairpin-helix domain-containing protein [Candidatus Hodarchaeota archaeon]